MFNDLEENKSQIKNTHFLKKVVKIGKIFNKDTTLEERLDISDNFIPNKFVKIVEEFKGILEYNFSPSNQETFDKNIKSVKIKDCASKFINKSMNKEEIDRNTLGLYSQKKNEIKILCTKDEETKIRDVLMHELLHMSSAKDEVNHGLSHAKKVKDFYSNVPEDSRDTEHNNLMNKEASEKFFLVLGDSIDEGYTELLNQTYFSKNMTTRYYQQEKVLVSGLQRIIGEKKMQDIYFNGSFFDVIGNLAKYEPDEDYLLNLIYRIDKFSKDEIKRRTKDEEYNYLKKEITNIYSKKLEKEFLTGQINEEEYEKRKFYNIEMYLKEDFIYTQQASVIEKDDKYVIIGGFGVIEKNKEEVNLRFEPNLRFGIKKYNEINKNK